MATCNLASCDYLCFGPFVIAVSAGRLRSAFVRVVDFEDGLGDLAAGVTDEPGISSTATSLPDIRLTSVCRSSRGVQSRPIPAAVHTARSKRRRLAASSACLVARRTAHDPAGGPRPVWCLTGVPVGTGRPRRAATRCSEPRRPRALAAFMDAVVTVEPLHY
jgi:hypothetical protein